MKVGIVSFAHLHAEAYIENLRAHPDVSYVGFFDPDPQRRSRYGTQHGSPTFDGWDAFLKSGVEAAIVCSENVYHRRDVEALASAGIHVLCEKPLAPTPVDARAIVEACSRAGVILMTAFPMRFSMPIVGAKAALDRGEYGALTGLIGRNQGQCPYHHRSWFVDPKLAGGGAMMDHTVHLADIYRWYTACEVTHVYAVNNHITYREESDVETGGLIALTFSDGRQATIDCSWSRPHRYPTWGGLAVRLLTDRGIVDVDAFRQIQSVYGNVDQHVRWDYWGSDANQAMVNEFVSAATTGRTPAVTGNDGLRAVEIADAAYRSAATGLPVDLSSS